MHGKRRVKFALRSLLAALILLVALGGYAFGHAVTCYTALGYTITCQPKIHDDHNTWHSPPGAWFNDYSFKAGVMITQTQTGSFRWDSLILTDGVEVNDYGYFGDAYVFQTSPFAELLVTNTWFCYPMSLLTYGAYSPYLTNNSTTGYWHMYSTSGYNSCYNPNPFTDYTAVQAY